MKVQDFFSSFKPKLAWPLLESVFMSGAQCGFAMLAAWLAVYRLLPSYVLLFNSMLFLIPGEYCWDTHPTKYVQLLTYGNTDWLSELEPTVDSCLPTETLSKAATAFVLCTVCTFVTAFGCFCILRNETRTYEARGNAFVQLFFLTILLAGLWVVLQVYSIAGRCTPYMGIQMIQLLFQDLSNRAYYGGSMPQMQDLWRSEEFVKLLPACYNAWLFFQGMVFIVPLVLTASYAANLKGMLSVKVFGSQLALQAIGVLYSLYGPKYNRLPYGDREKMIGRLVVHPIIFEFVNATFRFVANAADAEVGYSKRNGILLYGSYCFAIAYGRILVNTVSDPVLLVVSSVIIGFIEIFMRLTAFQRDALFVRLVKSITGKGTNAALDIEISKKRKVRLLVLETELEISGILLGSAIFYYVLIPSGAKSAYKEVPQAPMRLASLGYTVGPYIWRNFAYQIMVEVATDILCAFLEIRLFRINLFQMLSSFDVGSLSVKLFDRSIALFYCFASNFIFCCYLFWFPHKFEHWNDSMLLNAGGIYGDIADTWINLLPNDVESVFTNDWVAKNLL